MAEDSELLSVRSEGTMVFGAQAAVRQRSVRTRNVRKARKPTENLCPWNAENWLTDRKERLFIFTMWSRIVFLMQEVGG
jgi:hypothetical protein